MDKKIRIIQLLVSASNTLLLLPQTILCPFDLYCVSANVFLCHSWLLAMFFFIIMLLSMASWLLAMFFSVAVFLFPVCLLSLGAYYFPSFIGSKFSYEMEAHT